jgi:hypothetical protein
MKWVCFYYLWAKLDFSSENTKKYSNIFKYLGIKIPVFLDISKYIAL